MATYDNVISFVLYNFIMTVSIKTHLVNLVYLMLQLFYYDDYTSLLGLVLNIIKSIYLHYYRQPIYLK